MRTRLWTLLSAALIALPLGTAQADSLQENKAEAERLATEALTKIMRALNLMIDTVPQYAAPEILPNGDIIIRRLNPDETDDEPIETDGGAGVET